MRIRVSADDWTAERVFMGYFEFFYIIFFPAKYWQILAKISPIADFLFKLDWLNNSIILLTDLKHQDWNYNQKE